MIASCVNIEHHSLLMQHIVVVWLLLLWSSSVSGKVVDDCWMFTHTNPFDNRPAPTVTLVKNTGGKQETDFSTKLFFTPCTFMYAYLSECSTLSALAKVSSISFN